MREGKVVFDIEDSHMIFFIMVRKNALPEGKIANFYSSDASTDDKIIIDVGKKKFTYSKYIGKLNKKSSHSVYRNYVYDLSKVNLDVFFEAIISGLPETLKTAEFRNIVRKILKNKSLKKRFYKAIKNSFNLKHGLLNKIKDFIESVRCYIYDLLT